MGPALKSRMDSAFGYLVNRVYTLYICASLYIAVYVCSFFRMQTETYACCWNLTITVCLRSHACLAACVHLYSSGCLFLTRYVQAVLHTHVHAHVEMHMLGHQSHMP